MPVSTADHSKMKLSVITVTYNAAACVEAALQSLRAQSFPNIELIVVDGGSKDDTCARVARFLDLKPQVLSEPDHGIYDAMNKGVALATGDAIYFLNADDRLAHPDSLAHLVKALTSDPSRQIVFGDVVVTGESSDHWRSHRQVTPARFGFETLCHQATLTRRAVFEAVGGFDTSFKVSADLDWFMRCGNAGLQFGYVPHLVCCYASGGESDKQTVLRLVENKLILRKYRTGLMRWQQRAAAAVRRRLARVARALS